MRDHEPADGVFDPAALIQAIAERSGVGPEDTSSVLASFGVTLTSTPAGPRNIRIERLRLTGVKTGMGVVDSGRFDASFRFGPGMTALVTQANLRGKTSILELITFCLRGSARNLRADVRSWLETVSLDALVLGQPLGIRLELRDGVLNATVLTASSVEEFADVGEAVSEVPETSGIRVLARTTGEDEFAAFMTQFMLDRLGLEPVANWQRHEAGKEDGVTQLHSWPAYFGAIYLPDAGDSMLLGDQAMAGLPGRLLQLFCDVPLAATLTRVNTAVKQLEQDQRSRARRDVEDAQARAAERTALENDLATAQTALAATPIDAHREISQLLVQLDQAENRLAEARRAHRSTVASLAAAAEARQDEERTHIDAMETALARRLFQGLNPRHCPRCETTIDVARATAERELHRCAVCTTVLDLAAETTARDSISANALSADANTNEDEVTALAARVEALRAAERAAQNAMDEAANAVTATERETESLAAAIGDFSTAEAFTRRRDLELTVARLSGALDAMPAVGAVAPMVPIPLRVLRAAAEILDRATLTASRELFADLNEEIVTLGRAFGIDALEAVELNRAAHLKVTTAGARTVFGRLSRGERLRLRVAVLIALLRVGGRRGVGTHPGLILLDSPAAEEVSHDDARALLAELHALREELPALQIVVATAAPDVVAGVLPEEQVYRATGDHALW